jgi:hypothetical protein
VSRFLASFPALVFLGALGVATSGAVDRSSDTRSASTAPVIEVSAAQRAGFEVFDRPADAMPPAVREAVTSGTAVATFGLNPDLARAVLTPASSTPVWLIPGDGFLCLWIKDPIDGSGTTCTTTEQAAAGELYAVLQRPDRESRTIAGFVARDVDGVLAGAPLRLREGAYGGVTGADSIVVTDRAGTSSTVLLPDG